MAVLTTQAQRRVESHERILQGAMNQVTARGVEGLSMNALAKTLGYTPGALYRYFDGKQALIGALAERVLEAVRGALSAALEGHEATPPLTRLVRLAQAYRAYGVEHPNEVGLLMSMLATPRVLVTDSTAALRLLAEVQQTVAPVAQAIDEAVRTGTIEGDPFERLLLLLAGLHGILNLEKQARRTAGLVDVAALTDAMLKTLLLGFGASPAAVEAALSKGDEDNGD